jgi:hypothetical protein
MSGLPFLSSHASRCERMNESNQFWVKATGVLCLKMVRIEYHAAALVIF